MTSRNLEYLFRPKSVAVIAEPGEPGCYPEVALLNLGAGGFHGTVIPIDVKKHSLFGISGKPRISHPEKLDAIPELAITCTPLEDVPRIVAQLGALGTRAVIVGPSRIHPKTDVAKIRQQILDAARPTLMRVLGPGSGGIMIPALGLNASVAPVAAAPGKIALITQSAAIAAAVLDRAATKGVGFSAVIHLGNSVDVDLSDTLDWLATDPDTEAILVQFDDIAVGRKFMSAARAAARNKPVVAIRSREAEDSACAHSSPTGSADQIYEAAMHRAGWVRIETLEGLFEATEALARIHPPRGEKLSIIANGRGLGSIAANALLRSGGKLATLSAETQNSLKQLLKTGTRLTNPVALPPDIKPADWAAALTTVLADPATDAVLTIQSPTAFNDSTEVAAALVEVAQHCDHNIFTCWVGGTSVQQAREVAANGGLLSFDAPEKATLVFQRIVSYARNRALLLQAPPSHATDFSADEKTARAAIAEALTTSTNCGELEHMPERLARKLLQAYRIAGLEPVTAASIEAAVTTANAIGFPVDLELVLGSAPTATDAAAGHLSAVPLSVQGLRSNEEIAIATRGLRSRARAAYPGVRVSAYRLRPSGPRSNLPPLRLGTIEHPAFGPVVYLGLATRTPERSHKGAHHCAVALPPLNPALAHDLIARAGISDLIAESGQEALLAPISDAIVSLSQLLTDIDEVASIELNPLHVEATGVVALKAQIGLTRRDRHQGYRRFAIRPYPKELERTQAWGTQSLLIRPIRPEDEAALSELLTSLDPNDARMRFFGAMRELPRSQLARFTQIDYDREMALVATLAPELSPDGSQAADHFLGEVRVVADPDNHTADFAIVVRSDIKGKGLGRLLMESIVDYARHRGITLLRGETFAENLRMQRLAQELGFTLAPGDAGTIALKLDLKPDATPSVTK